MTGAPCPGQARGVQDHDARHVAARLVVPWDAALPVRVEVVHRCETWGCPLRGEDVVEAAREPEAVLRMLLGPRGMLAPSPKQVLEAVGWKEVALSAPAVHMENRMDAVRDAPRPQVGATTSDPDDFLRRATASRPRPEPEGGLRFAPPSPEVTCETVGFHAVLPGALRCQCGERPASATIGWADDRPDLKPVRVQPHQPNHPHEGAKPHLDAPHNTTYLPCATGVCGHVDPPGHPDRRPSG